ncbi:MAG: uracil-DNA glycosylase [Bdellovibrionales bacterium]|nr:uracil-DNA glycosylase [Ramlibacter sp.]
MSLELDERRVAMLMEMNLKVWSAAPAGQPPESRLAEPAEPGARMQPQAVIAARGETAPAAREETSPAPRAPISLQPLPAGIATMDWAALEQAVAGCRACALCGSRKNTVFGVGSQRADWLVVGEAPGENEDLAGEPFVGQAGKLLDNMLKAIGLSRQGDAAQGAYVANVLKCRPPANRNPLPEEVTQCEPYLRRQVELLQPKIILALGRFAVQSLLQSNEPIGKLRGRVHEYHGVPVIVSYHPAYLLRSLPEKAKAWADLCMALEVMQRRA